MLYVAAIGRLNALSDCSPKPWRTWQRNPHALCVVAALSAGWSRKTQKGSARGVRFWVFAWFVLVFPEIMDP